MPANWTGAEEVGSDVWGTEGSPAGKEALAGEWTVKALQLYYTPALVLVGSAGNILSVAVIRSSAQLRRLSASVYLCALAVSDTAFLGALLASWFSFIQEESREQEAGDRTSPANESSSDAASVFSGVLCPLFVYLTHVSTFLSAWLVLAFTAERFVAVRYPLKRASLCTTRRARIVLSALTILSLAAFSPVLFIARTQTVTLEEPPSGNRPPEWDAFPSVPPPEASRGAREESYLSPDCLLEGCGREGTTWPTSHPGIDDYEETNNYTAADGEGRSSANFSSSTPQGAVELFTVNGEGTFLDASESGTVEVYTEAPPLPPSVVLCALVRRYVWVAEVLNGVDTVLAFLVPCLGIAALNAGIVASMWEAGMGRSGGRRKWRRQERSSEGRSSSQGPRSPSPQSTQDRTKVVRPTSFRFARSQSERLSLQSSPVDPMPPLLNSSSHFHPRSSYRSPPSSPRLQHARHPNRRFPPLARRRRPHAKITGMLLVVSTVFIVLNMPSYVIRVLVYIEESRVEERDGDMEARAASTRYLIIPQHAAHLLFNTNFGINFALYCVFGRNFRRALRSLFCRKRACRRCCADRECNQSSVCGRVLLVRGERSGTPERGASTVVSEYSKSCRRSTVINGSSSWEGAVEMESLDL